MEKTHWKKVFNSDYLGSCDIDDGTDLKAIIKEVVVKKVKNTDGKEQERNVAIFTDSKLKPMILNATNCKVIKKFTKSPYINDWKNVAVQIYIKNDIKAFGDTTEGLRLRDYQPAMSKPVLVNGNDRWANAIKFLKEGGTIEYIKSKYEISITDQAELLKQSKL